MFISVITAAIANLMKSEIKIKKIQLLIIILLMSGLSGLVSHHLVSLENVLNVSQHYTLDL